MLIGRDAACARIDELLLRGRGGRSGALLVRGEAGIGKTALLDYAVEGARDLTVVRALGVESEAELQFSGLLDCAAAARQLTEIPQPQADALRGALGLGSADAVDRFTIGAATLNLLAAAAESRPLLVVVDDAQWLDGATSVALLFAAKRLVADAVVLLFAARADEESGDFRLPGIELLDLAPLTAADAARLLAHDHGDAPAPDVTERLWEATGGNPLALIEARRLLSAAQLAGQEPLPEPVPAGPALERAFAGRAELPPPDSQRALLVAAVSLAHETDVETIAAALALMGIRAEALESAEDAGLVAIDEGRLTFRHPLVRSAVFHGAAPSERRAAHRSLADAMRERSEPEHRAWHLAGAALGHDEEAAAALELAAQQAGERSGYGAAATALARAADLTSNEDARLRRLHAAADAALRAGRPGDATNLLAEPSPRAPNRGSEPRCCGCRRGSTTWRHVRNGPARFCSRPRSCSSASTRSSPSRSPRRRARRCRSWEMHVACWEQRDTRSPWPWSSGTTGQAGLHSSRSAGRSATPAIPRKGSRW